SPVRQLPLPLGREGMTAMKTQKNTQTPTRRDLIDPRSSVSTPRDPRLPLLNDRRSTR
ncbi:MAG: hypothetical protein JWQ46_644, partial [Phenylobacterium sp.]|nr:hypothetical protein [Phenylobacterium sp.]